MTDNRINEFIEYLKLDKKMAANSRQAYRRDVAEFEEFQTARDVASLADTTGTDVVAFIHKLRNDGRSSATLNRKLASVRAYFNYLISQKIVRENPTAGIRSPRIKRKIIDYLSLEEIDRLLAAPDDSVRGKRDRAILETMYATGIRVTEVIDIDVLDVNLRMGFITCDGNMARARIIPLGRPSRKALQDYLDNGRCAIVKDEEERALFVNMNGGRITRQGIWKLLKEYGDKAGLDTKLTPNIIRNSFAVHMLQNGADIKSLQELMGHEDISATQAYLSAVKSRIKDVYDKSHPRA